MIWYLLVATFSVGSILYGLGEVVVAVLLLLRQAIDDVAGERAAGVVTLVVIVALAVVGYRALRVSDVEPEVRTIEEPQARTRVEPTRRAPDAAPVNGTARVRSRCGRGAAPDGITAEQWRGYRCASSTDGCLSWAAYASRPTQGCPGRLLCCPVTPTEVTQDRSSD